MVTACPACGEVFRAGRGGGVRHECGVMISRTESFGPGEDAPVPDAPAQGGHVSFSDLADVAAIVRPAAAPPTTLGELERRWKQGLRVRTACAMAGQDKTEHVAGSTGCVWDVTAEGLVRVRMDATCSAGGGGGEEEEDWGDEEDEEDEECEEKAEEEEEEEAEGCYVRRREPYVVAEPGDLDAEGWLKDGTEVFTMAVDARHPGGVLKVQRGTPGVITKYSAKRAAYLVHLPAHGHEVCIPARLVAPRAPPRLPGRRFRNLSVPVLGRVTGFFTRSLSSPPGSPPQSPDSSVASMASLSPQARPLRSALKQRGGSAPPVFPGDAAWPG
eukprot:TRINITY_DN3041_c0_g5_i1.p1 TRINITY_DN3041_c0_g5~~TRINITY_DN3041_c0_g5_i1.p1  ORF type:complete len:329 (+),score=67.80 TRINITY_DN3041_c0_g5_i1:31-1017(+)